MDYLAGNVQLVIAIFVILKKRLCLNKVSFYIISIQDMNYLMINTGQVE